MTGNLKNYLLAFASSMAYSYWLIGSSLIFVLNFSKFMVFSLFSIMLISLIISIIFFKKIYNIKLDSFLSGIFYVIANVLLYLLIDKINIVIAGSFTALNLVFFPILIYSGNKKILIYDLIGSSIIAAGLIIESLTTESLRSENLILSIFIGIIMGLFYALATLFFNNSLIKNKNVKQTIQNIFLSETVIFFLIVILTKNFPTLQNISMPLIINLFLISISIFVGIYLEAYGFKGIKKSQTLQRNLVNILSNFELLPIAILSIFEYPSIAIFYISGLFLIILGLIIISLRI